MKSQRRARIKQMLDTKPFISLKELAKAFPDTSLMTLRRDIEYFESTGDAIKVRGGAKSMHFITSSDEHGFNHRQGINPTAKEKIARRAVDVLGETRSLFLDSGTTMMTLASMLPDERYNITTTGLNVALELSKKNLPIVNLVGGLLNRYDISLMGNQALRFLERINIDVALMSPSGLSLKDGFTCGNYAEAEIKQLVVEKARRVILLVDSAKLNKNFPFTFCKLDKVHTIVTDSLLPEDITEAIKNAGIELVIAK